MGIAPTQGYKLFEAIKADKADKVKNMIQTNLLLLDSFINASKDHTPLMCAAFFNSCNSLDVLVKMNANLNLKQSEKGNNIGHIAAERNNLKILKIIISKNLIDLRELNSLDMNILDSAIIRRSYDTALYLVNSNKLSLKPEKTYSLLIKDLRYESFKLNQFLKCIKENVAPKDAPSFLYKVGETHSIEGNELEENFQPPKQNNFILGRQDSVVTNSISLKLNLINNDECSAHKLN